MRWFRQASVLAFNCFDTIITRRTNVVPKCPTMFPHNGQRKYVSGRRSRHARNLNSFSSDGDNSDSISKYPSTSDSSPPSDSNELFPWEIPIQSKPAAEIVSQIANIIPQIHTERLYLRAPTLQDFQYYHDIATSDRWYDSGITCREDVWLDYLQMIAGWVLRGVGLMTVVDATNPKIVVGFVLLNHEFGDKYLEIGWMLVQEAEGNGYATEAASALLNYAHNNLESATPIVSYIAPTNTKSMKVAERLGGKRATEMENECYVYFYDYPKK